MAVESASEYPTGQSTRRRLLAGLIVLVALAGLVMASLAAVVPPAPVAGDAPADSFSATRAYRHVERVGSQQHVTGSPAAADVRDYIVSTLTGFGLQPQIQDTISATDQLSGPHGMARVRNVVAVLPGETSTGRIVMFAHYDSVQVSYGGNDDGAGVSTLLETARVLAAGPRPRNDIVFLFTDAEEACLCGAQAFVDQSPLAAQGGVAMNFESRGSSGPVVLFETSRGNANVVGVYADAVPYPVATSFAVEIYRILPNDTDFTPFRDSGRFSGLNSACIDGSAVYHAPEDRPSYMDQASLQQHGDNAVALARSLPALAGATGSIVAVSVGRFWLRVVVLGAAAAVAVVILAPTVALFFPALGLATGAAGAFFAVLLGLALLPVFELVYPTSGAPRMPAAQGQSGHPGSRTARHRLWAAIPAMTAGALALAFLGTGLAVDHFDADHPAPAQLFYALDADSGQARWLSTDSDPGEWVSQYVTGPEDLRGTFGLLGTGVLTGPAQPAALPAPALTVSSDSTSGDRRNLSITVTPQREVRLIYLLLPGAAVARASVAGHEIPTSVFADGTGVVFNGPPDRDTSTGVTFDLELDEAMPVTVRVMDGSDGLDELPGFTPRPPGVGVQGSHTSELVLVAKAYTV
jgi:Peptidase family M28